MNIVDQVIQQLGVSREQAEAGLGLILQVLREKLGPEFSKIAEIIPESSHLANRASGDRTWAGGSLLGALAGRLGFDDLGKLAGLAASFQKQGLDMDKLQRFVKTILAYVEAKGGGAVKDLLNSVLAR